MKFCLFFIFLFLMACANCDAQIITPIENAEEQVQTQQFEQLIAGAWVAEGASFSARDIYNQNGTYNSYYNNQLDETYYWAIYTATTESGLKSSTLIIRNTRDPTDERRYEIDTMTNERMVLVYNNGIGLQRNLYFRQ